MFDLPPGDVPLSQLFLLTMAACAGELGFSSVTTIAPTLLRRRNFSETTMSFTMGIGPFLALLAMPSLGRCTDRCTSRLGRRKPFLLASGLLLLLGITCIPNAGQLSTATAGLVSPEVILTVSVILCTFTAQVFYNPYQALISDICRTEQNARRGFAVFVLMINMGSIMSNLLFSWEWFPGPVASSQRATFGLIAVLVSVQMSVTLLSVREPPVRAPPSADPAAASSASPLLEDVGYGSDSSEQGSPTLKSRRPPAPAVPPSGQAALTSAGWPAARLSPAGLGGRLARRLLLAPLVFVCGLVYRAVLWPYCVCRRIYRSPMVLRRLFVVDLLSWMALISFYMFLTDYLGQAFGGRAEDPEGSEGRAKFDAGVRMGSKGLLIDSISGGLFSLFCLSPLIRRLGTRGTYVLCLTTFSCGLVAISLSSSPALIYLLCAVVGCGYSAIGTIPNSLLTLYHYQPEVFFDEKPSSETAGLGENFAILDMSFCLASILPSLTLGLLVDTFGMPHLYVLVGGVLGLLSAVIATTLIYKVEEMPSRTKPPTSSV